MKWITRENAKVERIACSWLIRRFVDKNAEFLFVPEAQVKAIAKHEKAISFDVPEVELGHVEGRCSFESIMLKFGLLDDAALVEVAKIVHDADVSADLNTSSEGPGLHAIAHGFALLHKLDDHKKIALETPMYDALYAWCQHRINHPE